MARARSARSTDARLRCGGRPGLRRRPQEQQIPPGWRLSPARAPPRRFAPGGNRMVLSVVVTVSETHAAVEAVIRMESARLIAGLARYTGDVGLGEELAQDAVVAALEQWPDSGVPRNSGAWLMTVAKRRAVDMFRRNRELQHKYSQIARALEAEGESVTPDFDGAFSDHIDDDLLRLIFVACHPILAVQSRVALTLRLLCRLTTAAISPAYPRPEPTIA